jgi:hypothetical protein
MVSERKSAASRVNGCKSCGPRTAAGKKKSSRNALLHGLAANTYRRPVSPQQIEHLAKAICNRDEDPASLAQARIIATNALVLRAIREQQIAVIERLRETTAIALAKGDNSIKMAKARSMKAWIADWEIAAVLPHVLEKYKNQMPPPFPRRETGPEELRDWDESVPIRLKAILEEPDREEERKALAVAKKQIEEQERDDHEALEGAVPDLLRLERYERRAWSRQKRAIRQFIALHFYLNNHCSTAQA